MITNSKVEAVSKCICESLASSDDVKKLIGLSISDIPIVFAKTDLSVCRELVEVVGKTITILKMMKDQNFDSAAKRLTLFYNAAVAAVAERMAMQQKTIEKKEPQKTTSSTKSITRACCKHDHEAPKEVQPTKRICHHPEQVDHLYPNKIKHAKPPASNSRLTSSTISNASILSKKGQINPDDLITNKRFTSFASKPIKDIARPCSRPKSKIVPIDPSSIVIEESSSKVVQNVAIGSSMKVDELTPDEVHVKEDENIDEVVSDLHDVENIEDVTSEIEDINDDEMANRLGQTILEDSLEEVRSVVTIPHIRGSSAMIEWKAEDRLTFEHFVEKTSGSTQNWTPLWIPDFEFSAVCPVPHSETPNFQIKASKTLTIKSIAISKRKHQPLNLDHPTLPDPILDVPDLPQPPELGADSLVTISRHDLLMPLGNKDAIESSRISTNDPFLPVESEKLVHDSLEFSGSSGCQLHTPQADSKLASVSAWLSSIDSSYVSPHKCCWPLFAAKLEEHCWIECPPTHKLEDSPVEFELDPIIEQEEAVPQFENKNTGGDDINIESTVDMRIPDVDVEETVDMRHLLPQVGSKKKSPSLKKIEKKEKVIPLEVSSPTVKKVLRNEPLFKDRFIHLAPPEVKIKFNTVQPTNELKERQTLAQVPQTTPEREAFLIKVKPHLARLYPSLQMPHLTDSLYNKVLAKIKSKPQKELGFFSLCRSLVSSSEVSIGIQMAVDYDYPLFLVTLLPLSKGRVHLIDKTTFSQAVSLLKSEVVVNKSIPKNLAAFLEKAIQPKN